MKNRNLKYVSWFISLKKNWLFLICLLVGTNWLFGQQVIYPEEKPGKTIADNQLFKHDGLDYPALVKTANATADWFYRNHPLIQAPKGFDLYVRLFGNSLPANNNINNPGYGEMFSINFSFHYFYMENGIEKTATGWSAHDLDIRFNQPFHELARPMGDRGFEEGDDPSLKQALNQAHDRLQRLYSLNPVEKKLAPGVDLYSGRQLLVSDPNQPSPWVPVTVGEVTRALLDYYKIRKASDEYRLKKTLEKLPEDMKKMYIDGAKVSVYDLILKEFESLSPDDMIKPAFTGSGDGFYNFNTHGDGKPVVKYNSGCWNKSLPRTSVQFVSIKYVVTSDDELKSFRKRNSQLKDYVGLFMNALPVEKMGELINIK